MSYENAQSGQGLAAIDNVVGALGGIGALSQRDAAGRIAERNIALEEQLGPARIRAVESGIEADRARTEMLREQQAQLSQMGPLERKLTLERIRGEQADTAGRIAMTREVNALLPEKIRRIRAEITGDSARAELTAEQLRQFKELSPTVREEAIEKLAREKAEREYRIKLTEDIGKNRERLDKQYDETHVDVDLGKGNVKKVPTTAVLGARAKDADDLRADTIAEKKAASDYRKESADRLKTANDAQAKLLKAPNEVDSIPYIDTFNRTSPQKYIYMWEPGSLLKDGPFRAGRTVKVPLKLPNGKELSAEKVAIYADALGITPEQYVRDYIYKGRKMPTMGVSE